MKRILTLLLTLAMTLSLAMPAQAANNTQASTMRLMETEGTATVENAIGKKLTIQDKMRLYNGYEVSTQKASYAYISLDSSKAVKLDASSSVTVNQSGKKLELDVTAGELFFNVPVALKSDESLKIRSSTMVTGIRGTAGWVNAMDRYTTRIGVLEGAVTIQSQDPFTGANRSVTIVGGQIATIIRHERANAIQQQLINDGVIIEENIVSELTKPGQIVEELQEDDVPGFVAAEVAKDDELRNRINEESPLDADEIANNADDRLLADQMAADKNDPETNDYNKDQESIFGEPEIIYVTVTKPGAPVQDPILDTEDPDVDEIQESLDELDVATVTNVDDLDLSELDFDEDDVLNIVSGTAIVGSGSAADIAGTVNVFADAKLTNNGSITITSKDSLHIYGVVVNDGTINIGTPQTAVHGETDTDSTASQSSPGKLVVENAGTLKNHGNITISEGSEFIVLGNYEDTVNEVFSQNENGAVTYLGSFAEVVDYDNMSYYTNMTFKILDTNSLIVYDQIFFDANTKITLDMNGNSANLISKIPAPSPTSETDTASTETMDVQGFCLVGPSDPYGEALEEIWSENYDFEFEDPKLYAIKTPNLTLKDSVGGGELNGSFSMYDGVSVFMESGTVNGFFESLSSSFFKLSGGTIVVPKFTSTNELMQAFPGYCPGISTTGAFLSLDGGTIDASAANTCALMMDFGFYDCLYYDLMISCPMSLNSGTLIGRNLFHACHYYDKLDVRGESFTESTGALRLNGFAICSPYYYDAWDGFTSSYPMDVFLFCTKDSNGIYRSDLKLLDFIPQE